MKWNIFIKSYHIFEDKSEYKKSAFGHQHIFSKKGVSDINNLPLFLFLNFNEALTQLKQSVIL